MDPVTEAYVRLAVYVGTAVLLLRIIQLLVLVPVAREEELNAAQVRVLTVVAQVALAIFALTQGFHVAAEVLHLDVLHRTAEEFTQDHLQRIVLAGAQAAIVKSAGAIGGAVKLLGLPAEVVSQVLTRVLDRLYYAGEVAAVMLVLLKFGHKYVMSTLFPLGVVVLLIPGARYAGGFLVAAALTLWLVLPATLVGVIMPIAKVTGMDADPPLGFFLTALPLLFPPMLVMFPPAIPVLIELWREFFSWYIRELLLWLCIIPAVTGIAAAVSMIAVMSAVGGSRVVYILRRFVRYVLPIKGIR